jgi:hypothetical protein
LFTQQWTNHIYNKSGCPKCNFILSRGEQAVADWVRSLGVTLHQRDRTLIKPLELDIVIPDRQLAIEYNGSYWHSVPVSARFDKAERNYHAEKTRAARAAGYRLLSIWEPDWEERPGVIQHWLQHQLGLAPKLCGARECTVQPVRDRAARDFYRSYHLQGPSSSGQHFGLHHGERLVALMTLTRSATDRKTKAAKHTYWLARFALAGPVPGAASRLFKAAVAGLSAEQVITYSDHQYASGNIYEALGFKPVGAVKPDYRVYHPIYGIRHKSFWQRKNIPVRLRELGLEEPFDPASDPRSEFDMAELAGCRHVWDAGKTRWLWTPTLSR